MKNILNNKKVIAILLSILAVVAVVVGIVFGHSHSNMTYVLPNGAEFKPDKAKNGTDYLVPDNPQMPEKWIFTGWKFTDSKDVEEDTSSEETSSPKKGDVVYAHAQGRQVPVFDTTLALAGGYGTKGNQVTLPLKLCGEVNIGAFEVAIKYDPELLEFVEFQNEDPGIVINAIQEEGLILLNYLDSENTVGDVDLVDIVFKITGNKPTETKVTMTVDNGTRYGEDGKMEDAEIVVISSKVTIV